MLMNKLQILDPKYWSGLTRESHLGYLGLKNPQYINKFADFIYEQNYGDDNIVSLIEKFPVHYIDEDGAYRWRLIGAKERSIPVVKATYLSGGTETDVTTSTTAQIGLKRTPFWLYFAERYFSRTSVIVGRKPELYNLRVSEEPVQVGSYWKYKVELITGDDTLYVPVDDLTGSAKFAELYGLVSPTLSRDGSDIHFGTWLEMENTTSYIRQEHEVPGNMIGAGKNSPMIFPFVDDKTKKQTFTWIDYMGWEFLTQFRRSKARLLLYGKSNKLGNGEYGNKDNNGETLRSGFGLYEQMQGGNLMFYNTFSLDALTDFAMQISVGKLPEDKREFILSTGQYGAYQFHKAASQKLSGLTYFRSDHNIKTDGNKFVLDEGQIMSYVSINGIKFHLMIDPMKDSWIINQIPHPQGGLASSYTYDIWDIGTTNGEPNIMRVAVKNQEEFFRYIPGMRDPFTPGANSQNPTMTASPVDGYKIMKMFIGSIMLKNVYKTGRIMHTSLM